MNKFEKLENTIIKNSISNRWNSAVQEWDIISMDEDEYASSECICGNEGLRYLFEIKNRNNNNVLFPIGSTCIKHFEREDLSLEVNIRNKMLKLYKCVNKGERIELNSDYFSRNSLSFMYENNVFKSTKYNDYNPYKDYRFMLDMFNKRVHSENQVRKINAIIVTSIIPYIRSQITR